MWSSGCVARVFLRGLVGLVPAGGDFLFEQTRVRVLNMHSYTKGLLCSTAAAALMASAPAQANDMNEMRAELQNLLDRMERIEQAQGQAQVAIKIEATQALSCVDGSCGAVLHRHQPNIVNASTRRKINLNVTNEVSLCSRSHNFCDPVGAPRWYRQALECFKAIDDYFGVAHAAAAFASASLGVVFAETTTVSYTHLTLPTKA